MAEDDVLIRLFAPGDGHALAGIYRRAVAELARSDYSAVQLAAWVSVAPSGDAFETLYGDGRHAIVAVDARGRPVGFSDLRGDGHIQFLYVDAAAAGRGIAARMLAALETAARRKGFGRIYSEASETALPVFLRSGFVHLHRRDLEIDGVAIHNHAVEKRLLA